MSPLDTSALAATAVAGDIPVVAITDDGLGNTSWLVDLGDGTALVVDPERDPLPYLEVAERLGVEITVAADTHLHADFITGSPELGHRGAEVLASAGGDLAWPHRALGDGEELDLGRWRLRALATPGHTPEHLAYLLVDRSTPRAVFTGGSLLVGAVARTDLIDPEATEHLTRALWRSMHQQLLGLDDDVMVLPTHGAGSFCSASGGSQRWTTIGAERRTNPLLAAPDEDAFVHQLLGGLGSYPPYFLCLREVNRRGPRVFAQLPRLDRLSAGQVRRELARGAVLVDARPVTDYVAGHVPGSLANALRPQFASWLGWLVPDPSTPLMFILDEHQDRRELVRQCLNIGYEQLVGELDGGARAWSDGGGELEATALVSAEAAGDRSVLDVRQAGEWASGHLPGAAHVELGGLAERIGEVPDGPVVVMCGHGERAATAASLLAAAGRHDVAVLDGGPDELAGARGTPLER